MIECKSTHCEDCGGPPRYGCKSSICLHSGCGETHNPFKRPRGFETAADTITRYPIPPHAGEETKG